MRDYVPTTWRYLQADPLGFVDGASVYGFARQTPMLNMDLRREWIAPLLGAVLAIGIGYFTNPCATLGDPAFAGLLGAAGGGTGKADVLGYGPKALTRVTGKEWSHAFSRETVNRYTSGWLNRVLDTRGGYNGSWISLKRHFRHDLARFPPGWRQFGDRFRGPFRALDRISDWLKSTIAGSTIASYVAGCGCEE